MNWSGTLGKRGRLQMPLMAAKRRCVCRKGRDGGIVTIEDAPYGGDFLAFKGTNRGLSRPRSAGFLQSRKRDRQQGTPQSAETRGRGRLPPSGDSANSVGQRVHPHNRDGLSPLDGGAMPPCDG